MDETSTPRRAKLRAGLRFAALVYLFFVCIELLGGSFTLFGAGVAETLLAVTNNPLLGLLIGLLATSLMQSSSTTTSLIVGMVASGALTIDNAIPMVMGANVGTTITNTIVSLGHLRQREEFQRAFAGATVHDCFNLLAVAVLLPMELIFQPIERLATWLSGLLVGVGGAHFHSPLKAIVDPLVLLLRDGGLWLLGSRPLVGGLMASVAVALLVFALSRMVGIMRGVLAGRIKSTVEHHLFSHWSRSLLLGFGLTALVQSSSVTTSLAVPMIGAGVLDLRQVFPYMVGANLGTTVTALMASLVTGSPAAVTVALCHLVFNLMAGALFLPLKVVPIRLAQWLGGASAQRRWLAPAYVLLIFFALPGLLMWVF